MAAGAFFQAGSYLLGAYSARQEQRLQNRNVAFQNAMGQRDMAVQNAQLQSQWRVQKANAALSRAQAQAENLTRDANNLLARSSSDLTNWARSINNNRILAAAGEEHAAAVANDLRMQEAQVGGTIEARLAAAEQRGALAAATALSGTQGSSIDALSQAFELRDQRRQFYQERQDGYADYDALQQIIGIVPQAAANLDTTVTQAQQTYGVSVGAMDPLQPVGSVFFNRQVPTVSGNTGTDLLAWFANPANDAANRQIMDRVGSWFTTTNKE